MAQSEYISKVTGHRYNDIIAEHGGNKSAGWKKKCKELIEEHEEHKAKSYREFRNDSWNQSLAMKQLISSWKKDASTAYTSGIHIAIVMASDIHSEATNKCNELYTNSKPMEDFMLGALGNCKVLLPKLHGRIQNLDVVELCG